MSGLGARARRRTGTRVSPHSCHDPCARARADGAGSRARPLCLPTCGSLHTTCEFVFGRAAWSHVDLLTCKLRCPAAVLPCFAIASRSLAIVELAIEAHSGARHMRANLTIGRLDVRSHHKDRRVGGCLPCGRRSLRLGVDVANPPSAPVCVVSRARERAAGALFLRKSKGSGRGYSKG